MSRNDSNIPCDTRASFTISKQRNITRNCVDYSLARPVINLMNCWADCNDCNVNIWLMRERPNGNNDNNGNHAIKTTLY